MGKKRVDWIDYAKAVGILAVIAGHVGFGEVFSHFIHFWHMPIFFIITGYLTKSRVNSNFFDETKGKVKSLILPYVSVGLLNTIVWIVKYKPAKVDIQERVTNLLWINTSRLPIATAIWFLTCMFFAWVIFYAVSKIKNIPIRMILFITIAACGMVCSQNDIVFPYGINQACVAASLMAIGHILQKSNILEEENGKSKQIVIFGLIGGGIGMINGPVNMRYNSYGNIVMFYFSAVTMSCMIFVIVKYLRYAPRIIMNTMKKIGENSIIYLCFNQIAIFFVGSVITRIFHIENALLHHGIVFCVVVCLLCILSEIILRTPVKVIFKK